MSPYNFVTIEKGRFGGSNAKLEDGFIRLRKSGLAVVANEVTRQNPAPTKFRVTIAHDLTNQAIKVEAATNQDAFLFTTRTSGVAYSLSPAKKLVQAGLPTGLYRETERGSGVFAYAPF